MYISPNLFLAAITMLARVATAIPPAGFRAALGNQASPAGLQRADAWQSNITSKCTGTNEFNALSMYSSSYSGASKPATSTAGTVIVTVASTVARAAAGQSKRSTAKPTSDTAGGFVGYSTGNSTYGVGVALGSGPFATTASSQSSQTSPISSAAGISAIEFSSFVFRLIAVLSIAALRMV